MKAETENVGFIDIELSRPFEINGVKVGKLRMREPTVADHLTADELGGSQSSKEARMISNLCEVSPDDIKRLPIRDYIRLNKALAGFID